MADKHSLLERELVWLYCRAWGNHADHILEKTQFQTFDREQLRAAFLELCFPNPERQNPESNEELVKYIEVKVAANGARMIDWCDSIYKELTKTPTPPVTVPKGLNKQ